MKKKCKKCAECSKKLITSEFHCQDCGSGIHKKCMYKNHSGDEIICTACCYKYLPLYKTSNNVFHEIFNEKPNFRNLPGFKIQSLIDELKKNQNEENSFLSDSIKSSYFTPSEFVKNKFHQNNCSIFHLNVASLGKHIDELKSLLLTLKHDFDIITLTETKIKYTPSNLININIEGYQNFHTPTHTHCGGTMIYVKNSLSAKLLPEFSKSEEGIFESIFVEIKNQKKSLIIGTIYRHPSSGTTFMDDFLHPTLDKLDNKKSKVIITGDFNYNLIKYESHKQTSDFFDLISSYSYRPLILQPSRITYKSNTLIDNIFVNDLSCNSEGGNITSSISDHFSQFSFCDIFGKVTKKKEVNLKRNYRHFKHEEFLK